MKPLFIAFFILSFFFSVNVFASLFGFYRKSQPPIKDQNRVNPRGYTVHVFDETLPGQVLEEVRLTMKTSGEELLEDADEKEVFGSFRDMFIKTDKNSERYLHYRELLFGKWWKLASFRAVMFDALTKEDISDPRFFFHWWQQVKTMGQWKKLKDYTLSSFEEAGFSISEVTAFFKSDSEFPDLHQTDLDPFLETALVATRNSNDFAREWRLIMATTDDAPD